MTLCRKMMKFDGRRDHYYVNFNFRFVSVSGTQTNSDHLVASVVADIKHRDMQTVYTKVQQTPVDWLSEGIRHHVGR